MIHAYYNAKIGTVFTNYFDKPMQVGIYRSNCLCAFVWRGRDEKTGEKIANLVNFYSDKKHIENQIKANGDLYITPGDITSIRLNTYYKESMVLAKYFTQEHHTVTLFYKEPKK